MLKPTVSISALVVAGGIVAGAVPAVAATTSASVEPPPVTVLTDRVGTGGGDIFVSPYGDTSTYANGPEILSPDGQKVVWSHRVPAGQEAADFREQTYDGKRSAEVPTPKTSSQLSR